MEENNINNIYAKFLNAKKAFKPLYRDAVNPFYKSKYAPLEVVISAVSQALLDNGLGFYQTVSEVFRTEIVKDKIISYAKLTTILFSETEKIETTYPIIVADADPQKLGMAVTYAKRYALLALCGIASEDDDAESVSHPQKDKKFQKKEKEEIIFTVDIIANNLREAKSISELKNIWKSYYNSISRLSEDEQRNLYDIKDELKNEFEKYN
jgi:hypothetical protein